MGCQLLRRFRLCPRPEIGGRADHREAQIRADPHRNHVLRHHLAGADAGIETPGHDVGQAILNDHLHLDVRIVRQKFRQGGPEERPHRMVVRRDAAGAGELFAQRAQRGQVRVDLVKPRPGAPQKPFAGVRRCDAARGGGQQPKPEPCLKAANGLAERGLRHPELGHDVIQVGARHSEARLLSSCALYRLIAGGRIPH